MLRPETAPPASLSVPAVRAGPAATAGASALVYETARPFEATRLARFLASLDGWAGVDGVEGVVWVEADHRVVYALSESRTLVPSGMWWAALPRAQWMGVRPPSARAEHPRFGDRAQRLRFSGTELPEVALRTALEACLLDEETLQTDMASWSTRPNPFPVLRLEAEAS